MAEPKENQDPPKEAPTSSSDLPKVGVWLLVGCGGWCVVGWWVLLVVATRLSSTLRDGRFR